MNGIYNQYTSTECKCCGVDVGADDSKLIEKQLENREKNCMWCGEDFNLSEDEITEVLSPDGMSHCSDIYELAKKLNLRYSSTAPITAKSMIAQIEEESYEKDKKEAIMRVFGVDIDKEVFDPGYADKQGNPRDRIFDGIGYEQINSNDLARRILKYVKKNPHCNTSAIISRCRASRVSKITSIDKGPIARLLANGFIECSSEFAGFYQPKNSWTTSRFFGKIPKFNRKFIITRKGEGLLNEFENGKKAVLV